MSPTTLLVGGAIAFTLMACYGGPPPPANDPTSTPPTAGDAGPQVPIAK